MWVLHVDFLHDLDLLAEISWTNHKQAVTCTRRLFFSGVCKCGRLLSHHHQEIAESFLPKTVAENSNSLLPSLFLHLQTQSESQALPRSCLTFSISMPSQSATLCIRTMSGRPLEREPIGRLASSSRAAEDKTSDEHCSFGALG